MGRELAVSSAAAAAAMEYLSPDNAVQRLAIRQWKDNLLNWYFSIICAAFMAREIRNLIERRRKGSSMWPIRDRPSAFRAAGRCWRRAGVSICRTRRCAAGGRDARPAGCVSRRPGACPPPAKDEQDTLERIGAPADVRLACQLRPKGDVSVVPMVRTARPVYRATAPQRGGEREVVVLYCDFRNRADFSADHLPQDLLHVLTLLSRAEPCHSVGGRGIELCRKRQRLCAVRRRGRRAEVAPSGALQAVGAIEGVISDLNNRLGRSTKAPPQDFAS